MTPQSWMDALCSGDIDRVLSLYSKDAVLVPTFGEAVLQGHEEIRAYFVYFTGSRPNLCGEITQEIIQHQRCGMRVSSGTYRFEWGAHPPVPGLIKECSVARYTFVLRSQAEALGPEAIETHHSSEIPTD